MSHLLSTVGLAVSGGVGLLAVAVGAIAFARYKTTRYWRVLLPLTISLAVFTLAHWLVLVWPAHPPLLDFFEPLAYTGLLLVVYELAAIHPRISRNARGEKP